MLRQSSFWSTIPRRQRTNMNASAFSCNAAPANSLGREPQDSEPQKPKAAERRHFLRMPTWVFSHAHPLMPENKLTSREGRGRISHCIHPPLLRY